MRKGFFSRVLVVLCIAVVLAYTVWAALSFMHSGIEPSTLTTAVYGFFGTELGLLCLKRIFSKNDKKEGVEEIGAENMD